MTFSAGRIATSETTTTRVQVSRAWRGRCVGPKVYRMSPSGHPASAANGVTSASERRSSEASESTSRASPIDGSAGRARVTTELGAPVVMMSWTTPTPTGITRRMLTVTTTRAARCTDRRWTLSESLNHADIVIGMTEHLGTITEGRNLALDRVALGSNCPECGATPDEPCRTRRANAVTVPHGSRIDRACGQYRLANAGKAEAGDMP